MDKIVCPNCGSEKVFKVFKKEGKHFINDGTEFTDEFIEGNEIYCGKCGCIFKEKQHEK